jgi:exodeoxyribonuclease (lambda-induced)
MKVREGKTIASYVARKLAEKWLGAPLQTFKSGDMDQGSIRETEAWPWYALTYDRELTRPGFIVSDDGRCGCSPDGIVEGERFGLEIKCPDADTHVAYLLAGTLPAEYIMQVQGSMLVTGFDHWTFLSYHPRFPQFVLDVARDEDAIAAIREGLDAFWEKFDIGWNSLVAANDGSSPSASTAQQTERKEEWK